MSSKIRASAPKMWKGNQIALRNLDILTLEQLENLEKLSLRTAAQFVGLVKANRDGLASYLGVSVEELLDLKHQVVGKLPKELAAKLDSDLQEDFQVGGALPPDYRQN